MKNILKDKAHCYEAPSLVMAADRVRGGYLRVSGLRVLGSVLNFDPRIGFWYSKYFGFGAVP